MHSIIVLMIQTIDSGFFSLAPNVSELGAACKNDLEQLKDCHYESMHVHKIRRVLATAHGSFVMLCNETIFLF
jgi:hypothetical protein